MENIVLESLFFVVTSIGFTLFVTALLILLDNLFAYSETAKWVGTTCLVFLVLLSTTFRLEHDGYVIMGAAPLLLIMIPLDRKNLYPAHLAYLFGTWISGGFMLTAVLF